MFPCIATAHAARKAPAMLSATTNLWQIDSDCCQASCHFDKSLFEDGTAARLGIILPSTLEGAVQKRKAEFIAGRYCARSALTQLGYNFDVTLAIGANRQPVWPEGFVGSITHSHGYASALAARREKVRALGLDSEAWIDQDRAENVSRQILTADEDHADHSHLFESLQHHLTMVFSAKESLYKCLFPLVNRFFGFQAAVITPLSSGLSATGKFRFELLEDLNAEFHTGFSGHGIYSIDDAGVHTAVILKNG